MSVLCSNWHPQSMVKLLETHQDATETGKIASIQYLLFFLLNSETISIKSN
jgi:hypothetical protein